MYMFFNFQSILENSELKMMEEVGLMQSILEELSEEQISLSEYGHLVDEALEGDANNWVAHLYASTFWRISGHASRAIECLRHAYALADPRHKYMPALGLAAGSQIYGATADGGVALCTSARLSSDVADTTGAGDAFIAAVGFAIACTPEAPLGKVMAFASAVAACKCTALGARSGLPQDAAASAALCILA